MSLKRLVVRSGIVVLAVAALGVAVPQVLEAQGCVVAHSVGGVGGPDNDGGYLAPGHWQLNFDYRHLYSFRHYVGSVEQVYRTQGHSNVRNRINLLDAGLTYQITPRFSVEGNIPVEFASRRYFIAAGSLGGGAPGVDLIGDYGVSGVGDVSFQGQGWVWNPKNNPSHNIQVGLGVQMPTGRDNIQNNFVAIPGTPSANSTADYSIQPGIGVWAIPVTVQSFQALSHSTQAYFNGSYLVTPSETNGVANVSPLGTPEPAQEAKVSAADEYLLQLGVAYMVAKVPGLTVTGGLRKEGVPAHDLIGGDEGFRRPGYAVSLEPGVIYSMKGGHDLITANIDRAVYRNRIASVPDMQLGTHGDAAFADWLWLASFQHRF
ncbi:hypothetical protein [Acidicapsa ligni]|uniref:hypothetical protein n=1 Tax=Acidicapsa ligni TaxID=542300 RepID=UPI0021E0467F|nr:hypothetical protein [Acidicapsa ligni]